MQVNGKVVVITGGASGIGRGSALAFAKRGARLVIADLNEARGTEVVKEIEALGTQAIFQRADVSQQADVEALYARALERFGSVDILMNNVGVLPVGGIDVTPLSEWERVFQINLFSYVRCIKTFLPSLEKTRGHIVNTASLAGLFVNEIAAISYAVSKAAVISLSENLAVSLRPKGIGVTCLCPAGVMTNIVEQMAFHEQPTVLGAFATREARLCKAEDVGEMVATAVEQEQFLLHTDPDAIHPIRERQAQDPQAFVAYMADFYESLAVPTQS